MHQNPLLNKLADNVVVKENLVTYKGTTGHPTRSLFSSIDRGSFTLTSNGSDHILVNHYTMCKHWVRMAFIGLLAGFIVKWWFGIMAFIWLGGINWTVTYFQQRKFTARLAQELNELCKAANPQQIPLKERVVK